MCLARLGPGSGWGSGSSLLLLFGFPFPANSPPPPLRIQRSSGGSISPRRAKLSLTLCAGRAVCSVGAARTRSCHLPRTPCRGWMSSPLTLRRSSVRNVMNNPATPSHPAARALSHADARALTYRGHHPSSLPLAPLLHCLIAPLPVRPLQRTRSSQHATDSSSSRRLTSRRLLSDLRRRPRHSGAAIRPSSTQSSSGRSRSCR